MVSEHGPRTIEADGVDQAQTLRSVSLTLISGLRPINLFRLPLAVTKLSSTFAEVLKHYGEPRDNNNICLDSYQECDSNTARCVCKEWNSYNTLAQACITVRHYVSRSRARGTNWVVYKT